MNHGANYHRVFWLTTAFTVLVIAIVVLRGARPTAQHDGIDRLAGRRGPRGRTVGDAVGDHPGQLLGLDVAADPGLRGIRRRRHGRLVALGAAGQTAAGVDHGC